MSKIRHYIVKEPKLSFSGKSIVFKPEKSRWRHYIPLSKTKFSADELINIIIEKGIVIDLETTTFAKGFVRVEQFTFSDNPLVDTTEFVLNEDRLITLEKGTNIESAVLNYAVANDLIIKKELKKYYIQDPDTKGIVSIERWVKRHVSFK